MLATLLIVRACRVQVLRVCEWLDLIISSSWWMPHLEFIFMSKTVMPRPLLTISVRQFRHQCEICKPIFCKVLLVPSPLLSIPVIFEGFVDKQPNFRLNYLCMYSKAFKKEKAQEYTISRYCEYRCQNCRTLLSMLHCDQYSSTLHLMHCKSITIGEK